jgi:hypothetical protein
LGIIFFSRWLPAVSHGQKPAWKGKIETGNGIKIMKNPKEPLYGEIVFDLDEDLSALVHKFTNVFYVMQRADMNRPTVF